MRTYAAPDCSAIKPARFSSLSMIFKSPQTEQAMHRNRQRATRLILNLMFVALFCFVFAERGNSAGPPPPADELWGQALSCIEDAVSNDSLGTIQSIDELKKKRCLYVSNPGGASKVGDALVVIRDNDPSKPYGFLTIPGKIISGIEDPQVNLFAKNSPQSSLSPNYWLGAWQALNFTVKALYSKAHHSALQPEQMGLAVNSLLARGQNELHIHMSCIRAIVPKNLRNYRINSNAWTTVPIGKYEYKVTLLTDLEHENPFFVMQSSPNYMRSEPASVTVVVTGQPGTGRYYLIEDYTHGTDPGKGEDLLDQSCDSVNHERR